MHFAEYKSASSDIDFQTFGNLSGITNNMSLKSRAKVLSVIFHITMYIIAKGNFHITNGTGQNIIQPLVIIYLHLPQ